MLGQGVYYWSDHFYINTFEWLTLNCLSSRHIKVSSIFPLWQLLVLINATKRSPSLCGVCGPLFSSQSPCHSWAAAHRDSCCCPRWGCRRGQLRTCSCQNCGFRVSWGCRGCVPTVLTHSYCRQPWPASRRGQQPNLRTLPGCLPAGEARGPQEIVHGGLCFQP